MPARARTNSPGCAYRAATNYAMATRDGFAVHDAARGRDIPVLIRWPRGATGAAPVIVWSHGGGADPDGRLGNRDWGAFLAQSGYIVIHQSHLPWNSVASPDVSFLDPRPRCFLALSPQGPGRFGWKDDSWREIFRPVMTMTGLGDYSNGEQAPDRLVPFERMPPPDKFRVFLDSTNALHLTFNLNGSGPNDSSAYLTSAGLAFFDAFLRDRPEARAWLSSAHLPLWSDNVARLDRK